MGTAQVKGGWIGGVRVGQGGAGEAWWCVTVGRGQGEAGAGGSVDVVRMGGDALLLGSVLGAITEERTHFDAWMSVEKNTVLAKLGRAVDDDAAWESSVDDDDEDGLVTGFAGQAKVGAVAGRAVLGSTPELGSEGEQLLPRLTAVSQGLVPLKGVPEPVEVMQVKDAAVMNVLAIKGVETVKKFVKGAEALFLKHYKSVRAVHDHPPHPPQARSPATAWCPASSGPTPLAAQPCHTPEYTGST
ncbi:hypothetical protein HaLaN_02466 [Haematococcus lacustris]|uniref:Uncharacterized protein n=1 Tax=Haematococcus lacustris TaxID=44745 RepID=A0A699YL42_HAELA|nr:hypothetical protein HaLaN_02466 [Haematococcus lacustris]